MSYFTSNVDAHFSFNSHFKETRVRLYKAVVSKLKGKASTVEFHYLLACLEEKSYQPVIVQDNPVFHRLRFIMSLKENFGQFRLYTKNKYNRVGEKMRLEMKELMSNRDKLHEAGGTDLDYIGGVEVIACLLPCWSQMVKKKRKRTGGAKSRGLHKEKPDALNDEQLDGGDLTSDQVDGHRYDANPFQNSAFAKERAVLTQPFKDSSLVINVGPLKHLLADNSMLRGLLVPFPSLHTYEVIDIDFANTAESNKLANLTVGIERLNLALDVEDDDNEAITLDADFRALSVRVMTQESDIFYLNM
jgi:hypothetical protein